MLILPVYDAHFAHIHVAAIEFENKLYTENTKSKLTRKHVSVTMPYE